MGWQGALIWFFAIFSAIGLYFATKPIPGEPERDWKVGSDVKQENHWND